jgi:hypothetical protein
MFKMLPILHLWLQKNPFFGKATKIVQYQTFLLNNNHDDYSKDHWANWQYSMHFWRQWNFQHIAYRTKTLFLQTFWTNRHWMWYHWVMSVICNINVWLHNFKNWNNLSDTIMHHEIIHGYNQFTCKIAWNSFTWSYYARMTLKKMNGPIVTLELFIP